MSLGSGLQVLGSAVGLYLVPFRVATTFYCICVLYYVGTFQVAGFLWFGVKCGIDYFVLCVITQILNTFISLLLLP